MLNSPAFGTTMLVNAWMRWPRIVPAGLVGLLGMAQVLAPQDADPEAAAVQSFNAAMAQYGVEDTPRAQAPLTDAQSRAQADAARAMGAPAAGTHEASPPEPRASGSIAALPIQTAGPPPLQARTARPARHATRPAAAVPKAAAPGPRTVRSRTHLAAANASSPRARASSMPMTQGPGEAPDARTAAAGWEAEAGTYARARPSLTPSPATQPQLGTEQETPAAMLWETD